MIPVADLISSGFIFFLGGKKLKHVYKKKTLAYIVDEPWDHHFESIV